ncbi:MAG TPA: KH domain-containing protein [Ktedonobacterales bacterium]|nr:KH domain-containing protein [Ktedonobacterales bacterium]
MEGLVEFIARNLVDDSDAVEVHAIRNDRYATVIGLRVNPDDLGKVIGRQGRVAKAVRSLMRASAHAVGKQHVGLEIDDQGTPPPARREQDHEQA